MKKIAFINQRYGVEVVGGSESYTRQMAEHLVSFMSKKKNFQEYKVEVLTSKAIEFKTWKNEYTEDVEELNGVLIRRFDVTRKRNPIIQRGSGILMHKFHMHTKGLEEARLKARGPYCPDLIRYIKEHQNEYEAFFFVTYMYYPAYFGAKEVYDKAYFIPTAHDEEPIYMNIFKEMFHKVRAITYLTQEEKQFVEKTFHNEHVLNKVIGMGINVPQNADEERFRKKFNIQGKYLIFAGRIEQEKGCGQLIEYYQKYCKAHSNLKLSLVLMGKAVMPIPENENIHYVGFVDEQDKYDGMKGATVICLPSRFESFSISLLEGMAYGNPALVNGECDVLRGHMIRSEAGLYYYSYEQFEKNLDVLLLDNNKKEMMQKAAINYINNNYCWNKVLEQFVGQIVEHSDER